MSLFKYKSKQLIGIDISSASVKIVELAADGHGYRLEGFAVKALPKGAVVEKNINDVDVVASAIRQAVLKLKTKSKSVAVAVAGSAVITKVISMPAGLSDEEMESQIILDADQYIPFPLDEVAIDFELVEQADGESGNAKVLLAACRRENIELRTEVLELANLHPQIIDVEVYAIERILPFMVDGRKLAKEELIAIIDIGAAVTSMIVLKDGKITYAREELFGGNHLIQEIQRRYGLSWAEAELAKIQDDLADDYILEVLQPFKDSVVQRVSRSLQFFYSSGNSHQVDRVMLAGGVANTEGLALQVQQKLDVVVDVVNPFMNMHIGQKVDQEALKTVAPTLMVAAGLAMRSFQ